MIGVSIAVGAVQGAVELSVADGSGALCAAVHAVLPNIAAQVSPWQAADAARVCVAAAAAAERSRYAHLRPRELRVLSGRGVRRPRPRRAALRAAWRFAVLAVRAQLRHGRGAEMRARACRGRRTVSRYRTYVAACSVLVLIRREADGHKAVAAPLDALATSLLPWLSANLPGTAAAEPGDAPKGWFGSQRRAGAAQLGEEDLEAPELSWLHDSVAAPDAGAAGLASHALMLLRAADDPSYSTVTVLRGDGEGARKTSTGAALWSWAAEVVAPDYCSDRSSDNANLLEGSVWQLGSRLPDDAEERPPHGVAEPCGGGAAGGGAPAFAEKRARVSVAELVQVRHLTAVMLPCAIVAYSKAEDGLPGA